MIKILFILYNEGPEAYFRLGWPAMHIYENYSDEFEVSIVKGPFDIWDITTLSSFDIIHFHRYFGKYESSKELWKILQDKGVKMIMDTDDHWEWPDEMAITSILKEEGLYKKELGNFALASYVTTTTDFLADCISEHSDNVVVIPNAINSNHPVWTSPAVESDVVRIAWLGSMQRHMDLETLRESITMLYADEELKGKFKFLFCGGDDETTEIFDGPDFERIPLVKIVSYGYLYDKVDVCLAPLVRSTFNASRSELKYVEAGMKKKVFIGENFGPYALGIEHGVNGLLVDDPADWYTHIKRVILDKELRDTLRNNLHTLVKDKFDIANVTKERVKFYKSICQ